MGNFICENADGTYHLDLDEITVVADEAVTVVILAEYGQFYAELVTDYSAVEPFLVMLAGLTTEALAPVQAEMVKARAIIHDLLLTEAAEELADIQ